jgi:hypothetical protein
MTRVPELARSPGADCHHRVVLIAEELMLLSLDPVSGRPLNGSGSVIEVCLTGALVAELCTEGLLSWNAKRFEGAG